MREALKLMHEKLVLKELEIIGLKKRKKGNLPHNKSRNETPDDLEIDLSK